MATRRMASADGWSTFLQELEQRTQYRCREIAELIVQEIEMGPATPRESGYLAESFSVADDPVTGDVVILAHARYWMFVEYGARGRDPQPFLATAMQTVKQALS
jgi:HK97 gp10 family phage protein